jgi:hypothetical protein
VTHVYSPSSFRLIVCKVNEGELMPVIDAPFLSHVIGSIIDGFDCI